MKNRAWRIFSGLILLLIGVGMNRLDDLLNAQTTTGRNIEAVFSIVTLGIMVWGLMRIFTKGNKSKKSEEPPTEEDKIKSLKKENKNLSNKINKENELALLKKENSELKKKLTQKDKD